jgi:PAS domain S-box-containing protein
VSLTHQSPVARYGIAVVLIAIAIASRLALDPVVGTYFPFFTIFFATLLASLYGGFGPGLLATCLGTILGARLLLPPRDTFFVEGFDNQGSLLIYMLLGIGISGLGGIMRTSRTRAQAAAYAVAEQREELRITLASIGDAVIATDSKGRLISLNPAAEALTGWSQASAAGRPLAEVFRIINEQTRIIVDNPAERVFRTGAMVGLANHTVLIARDGTERPIDDSAAPIRDTNGQLRGVVLVFRDVTETRRADATRRYLAAIVNGSEDAIVSKDLGGVITSWNPAAERVYGYSAAEMIGKLFSALVPPDRTEEVEETARRLREGLRVDHFETVRRRKDGRRIDVSVSYSPIRSSDGKLIGTAVITRDVTIRKREDIAARFLADASAVLAALTDEADSLQKLATLAVPQFADWCAIDMANPDGSLRRVAVAHADPNKVRLAHEVLQRWRTDPNEHYGAHAVIRSGASELVPELTDAKLKERVNDAELLATLRKLGLGSSMSVPLTVRGKVLGAITFIAAESGRRYDATDLAAAEDLAHRAAVALENAQLYEAVREADRRKDEFLATLAHELRNPLAPIRNSLYMLKTGGAATPHTSQAIEMMERQVHHLIRLVDDLLDVSRVMRGKVELRLEKVNLALIAVRAAEAAQPLLDSRSHALKLSVPDRPVWVWADPVRMAQILGNLLTNAAKYTDLGGRLGLAIEITDNQAVIAVRDTGIGIAPEMLARVFDLFVQADTSAAKTHGGMGIGLTLVRTLVERHGGTIDAKSAGLGLGSEFIFRLPLLQNDDTLPAQSEPPQRPATRFGRRVLVVDDHADAADSLAKLLEVEGHDVRIARNGPAAILAATSDPPEVMFLDLGMPGMDGFEVARRIRADLGTRNVSIVAMTGWGQEEDRRRTRDAGFNHHLVKPVELERLRELLADGPSG